MNVDTECDYKTINIFLLTNNNQSAVMTVVETTVSLATAPVQ